MNRARGCVLALAGFVLAAGGVVQQSAALAQDNGLTRQEKAEGWKLLFDGNSPSGWLAGGKPLSEKNVQDGALNPNKAGSGWIYHDQKFGNFILSCDFKVSAGCNSGIFFRVGNPRDEVYTGIEMQVLDSANKKTSKNSSGAVYDVQAPSRNTMKPAGEWNHVEITCNDHIIRIVLNGEPIIDMDLNRWTEPGKNPDGTKNKFKVAFKDMPREGYLGFQDHGKPVWFKNVKVKVLSTPATVADVKEAAGGKPKKRLLVITESKGFVHGCVNRKGKELCLVEQVLIELGQKTGDWEAVCSQDSRQMITAENLKNFDAVFFYTTGTLPLSDVQKSDLIGFIRSGKGFAGAHSATDTFYNWPEYGELIGGYFDGHPWHTKVNVLVEDPDHPATKHLGPSFTITDEIYQFKGPYSRDKLRVLMRLDMESVKGTGKRKDGDNALAWVREYGKGRVFYTALGHRDEVWRDPRFQEHMIGGLRYVLRLADADATPRGVKK